MEIVSAERRPATADTATSSNPVEDAELGPNYRYTPESQTTKNTYDLKRTLTAQDWIGPDDPENPLNWPLRKRIYRTTVPSLLAFAVTFGSSAICRFFAGFFGSPVLAVGAGTNQDLWAPVHRATASSIFLLEPFLGPALGPAVGGFAAQNKGWRWTQWPILFICVPIYLYSLGTKETYKKIILQKRAKAMNIPPPPKVGPQGLAGIKLLITVTLLRPVNMLIIEPTMGFLSLYIGFCFSILFAYFEAFPIVFSGVYHFSPGFTGLTFLGVGIGCVIAVMALIVIDWTIYRKKHEESLTQKNGAIVSPEHRLYAAMLGSICVSVGLLKEVHWISPLLASVPFASGNLMIFCSAALYLGDVYGPLNGASAMAANGLLRYSLAAAFPLFTIQMYDRLGIAWATSLLGFVSLAMLPIPWLFFKFGPCLRQSSRYAINKA